eukprot:TRINITY_DN12541_c0_g2_i3.p1 TRINITY_DN12541_c0_g2~~TRINITY_DN12541_c0_g2_i3.p1  ORF type:complete len:549 (-),score=89.91 TRINITY_DN12541_c0_g2_i3:105-1751(-)
MLDPRQVQAKGSNSLPLLCVCLRSLSRLFQWHAPSAAAAAVAHFPNVRPWAVWQAIYGGARNLARRQADEAFQAYLRALLLGEDVSLRDCWKDAHVVQRCISLTLQLQSTAPDPAAAALHMATARSLLSRWAQAPFDTALGASWLLDALKQHGAWQLVPEACVALSRCCCCGGGARVSAARCSTGTVTMLRAALDAAEAAAAAALRSGDSELLTAALHALWEVHRCLTATPAASERPPAVRTTPHISPVASPPMHSYGRRSPSPTTPSRATIASPPSGPRARARSPVTPVSGGVQALGGRASPPPAAAAAAAVVNGSHGAVGSGDGDARSSSADVRHHGGETGGYFVTALARLVEADNGVSAVAAALPAAIGAAATLEVVSAVPAMQQGVSNTFLFDLSDRCAAEMHKQQLSASILHELSSALRSSAASASESPAEPTFPRMSPALAAIMSAAAARSDDTGAHAILSALRGHSHHRDVSPDAACMACNAHVAVSQAPYIALRVSGGSPGQDHEHGGSGGAAEARVLRCGHVLCASCAGTASAKLLACC